ncbi:MAG: metallophosphoesterase [Candidatus Electrothrix sp. Rat3]|nr:metallophosphoesterase [Candidatus Electrothrix rattekaaiensis]
MIAFSIVLWLIFLLGRIIHRREGGLAAELLEVAGMQWMGSLFLFAVPLLIADLISGFGFLLSRAVVLRIRMIALACGVFLTLIAHVQGLRPPAVEQYETAVSGLPADLDGTTIAVLSDLHIGEMLLDAAWLNARVQQVQALKPDCIVLVGDLFERSSDSEALPPVLRQLSAPLGVFAVRGNHDTVRPGRPDHAGTILAASGIRLLSNEWTKLADGLVLAGIDDLTSSRRRGGNGQDNLTRALTDRPAGATVLLSHTPWLVEQAAVSGVSLMLSGHTHNGQIWPFNSLVRTLYPFLGGQYTIEDMNLFVCRGTGTWGPRMRLWQRGEIALIRLHSRNYVAPVRR